MKHTLSRYLAIVLVAGIVAVPGVSLAQSATATAQINNIGATLQQIKTLQDQIEALKASQVTLKVQAATEIGAFIKALDIGSQGDDVKALQALLATNASIYPEGSITGYFGKATAKAVKRFQKENGLEQTGGVGPKTRAFLNKHREENKVAFEQDDDRDNEHVNATTSVNEHSDREDKKDKKDREDKKENNKEHGKRLCAIVPPGHQIAPGWLRKHDGEKQIVPPCQILPPGIEKHDDHEHDNDHHGTTTIDIIPPVISVINKSIGASTSTVTWTTNELGTSKIYYSTTTPLVLSATSTLMLSNTTLTTNHSLSLSGLATSTAYYFVLESKDTVANTATSSEMSFTTLVQ